MKVAGQTKQKDQALDLIQFLKGLYESGRISKDELQNLVKARKSPKQHVLVFIAEQNVEDLKNPGKTLDLESLTQILADQYGQDYYHVDPLSIDAAKVTEVMSHAFAKRHNIMAVKVDSNEVTIASAEPGIATWEEDLIQVLRKPIKRVVANPLELERLTNELYRLSASIGMAISGGEGNKNKPGIGNLEQMMELGAQKEPEANDKHVVNIVDWLLQYAFEQRASDIHIEPRRDIGNVRFRIDGLLYTVYQIPMQVLSAVTSRLKSLGRMNVAEKRRPQDGRLKTKSPNGKEIELRLSTLPTAFGEKMVLRIFDPNVLLKTFQQLGLADADLERWNQMTKQKHGIVLITGPTGSGKTTTLYSTLKSIATKEVNVCTVEDPIEMVESSFNQMQVQENIDMTFANGVRALLRQDPDIIMIGEIRDLETAEMAIQAALTGHLVFSTLHTNDAPSAITRLLELDVPSYLIKATVIGVMAQRLVRVLCPHCKKAEAVDTELWGHMDKSWQGDIPTEIFKEEGCRECRDTGFQGREGIYEVMPLSEALQTYAEDKADLPKLRQQAYKEGMSSLRHSGAMKVAAGITTINEVFRVAPEAQ
jgi:general secretion pathway protein E